MSKKKESAIAEALERRLLFSADPISALLAADVTDASNDSPYLVLFNDQDRQSALYKTADNHLAPDADEVELHISDTAPLAELVSEPVDVHKAETRLEVVFVDTAAPDYQQLLDDLLDNGGRDRSFDVITIDTSTDGVSVISNTLLNYTDIDAVHIISHGSNGALQLGATTVDQSYLTDNADTIESWAKAFADGGDILFYGCDLASNEAGQQFVDTLSSLTAADVAASDDRTGHESLGGDWDFEYHKGDINTDNAFTAQLWADYYATLATVNGTAGADIIEGTSGADTLNGSGGNDIILGGVDILNTGHSADVGNFIEGVTTSEYAVTSANSGWSVSAGSVDFLGGDSGLLLPTDATTPDLRAIDLNDGIIETNLNSLTVGETYNVAFFIGADGVTTQSATVEVIGLAGDSVSITTPSGNTLANMDWQTQLYTFTATAVTETLRFTSTSGTATDGALISGVRMMSVETADGADTITGGAGADLILGGAGNDTIGQSEPLDNAVDTVDGGDGADNIRIYNGNTPDIYQDSGTDGAIDTLWGYTNGTSTYYLTDNFSKATTGIDRIYDAYHSTLSYLGSSTHTTALNWDLTGIDLLYIEYIRGGTQNDIITIDDTGTGIVSYIYGYGGDDTITDGAADMQIYGGTGNDIINAGEGTNTVYGDAGNDVITSGDGDDTINAGEGDNTINISGGANSVTTGSGVDLITTGASNDTINAGEGDNTINISGGTNSVTTGSGVDLITTGAGNDTINAGSNNDTINAGDGTNTVYGNDGDDDISTGSGSDTVYGNDGDDIINTGAGTDTIRGGLGSDTIFAGAGIDSIGYSETLDNAVDTVDGGEGADNFYIYNGNTPDIYQDSGTDGAIDTLWGYTNGTSTYYLTDNFSKATTGIDRIYDAYSTSYITYLGSSTHTTALNWDLTGIDLLYIEYIRGGTQNDIITIDDTGTGIVSYIFGYGGDDTITDGAADMQIYGGTGNDIINAGEGTNTVYGDAGNDVITSGDGDDTINAGEGDNTINISGGANSVTTGSGVDLITTGASNDTINAGEGDNTINISGGTNSVTTGSGVDLITTGAGNDTINAGSNNDTINAGDGTNTVYGNDGDDDISTGSGSDTVYGNDGDDIINTGAGTDTIRGGLGSDTIFAGAGIDSIGYSETLDNAVDTVDGGEGADNFYIYNGNTPDIYQDSGTDDAIDTLWGYTNGISTYYLTDNFSKANTGIDRIYDAYSTSYITYLGSSTHTTALNWDLTGIDLLFIEYIRGGTQNDIITIDDTGTGIVSYIYGYGGDDTITDGAADMQIYGGTGNDIINAGEGTNTVYGDAGNDVITSGDGDDTINAGEGDNTINISGGANSVTTGSGVDLITTGASNDTINAGEGDNTINISGGTNSVTTGSGVDLITTGAGNDTINAGSNNDTINAGDGTNTVYGNDGDDDISTGSGSDTVYGNDGDDIINTGAGTDTIRGGLGSDTIFAGAGIDSIGYSETLDNAVDTVDGGEGADNFYIYNGNTPDIYQDSGTDDAIDTLWGYTNGISTYYLTDNFSKANTGIDRIYDAYSTSYITYLGSSTHTTALNWDLTGIDLLFIEYIRGGTQNDIITIDDTGTGIVSYIYGYGGDDTITDGAADMQIYGGTGNDIINAGEGTNTVYGDAGNDVITSGDGDDTINAGEGDNTINISGGTNSVTTGSGVDLITTGAGNDTINAGSNNDTINAGDGTNTVYGNDGDDDISTGSGSDTVYGNDGDDIINTGAGTDTIRGGLGSDTIFAGAGIDSIGYSETLDNAVDTVDGGEGADNFYIYNGNTPDIYQDSGTDGAIDTLWGYTNGTSTYYLTDTFSKATTGIDRICDAYSTSYTTYLGSSTHTTALNWDLSGIDLLYIERIRGGTQGDIITLDDDGTGMTLYLYGYGGNDIISDGAGAHYLHGGNNNDTLYGGLGADYLYGDSGTDTARYDGDFADYTITRTNYTGNNNSGYLRVSETSISGTDEGNDYVYGTVEFLIFADGEYDVATDTFYANTAPVLDNTGDMLLTSITEDDTANSGQSIASAIASAGGNRITDLDASDPEGIALISTDEGNGYWEYSIDAGTAWTSIGTVASSNALLLRATDVVRFIPNTLSGTTGLLTFHAWDQSKGTEGTKVSIDTTGGISPYSIDTESAQITVSDVNDLPVATGNTLTASEDVALFISATDFTYTDIESDALASVTLTGLNLNGGTLTHTSGTVIVTEGMTVTAAEFADLSFTSALNDSTDSSFTYTVNDADAGVVSALMNITVNAVNDTPVATGNTLIASEDIPLVIGPSDLLFTDVEGDALTSVVISNLNINGGTLTHSAGAVTVTDGMTLTPTELADLTFISALNDSTDSSFTYTVNDADTGVVSAVLNITVNAVNDEPVATGNTVVANEDIPLIIGPGDFSYSDIENDTLVSVTITSLNLNGGTLTHSSGTVAVTDGMSVTAAQLADLTFTSAPNDSTDSSFSYTANDADQGGTSALMNITVNAVNDAPVAVGNTVIASEDIPLLIDPTDFLFTDIEGDPLSSVTISGLTLNGGTLTHSSGSVDIINGMTVTAAELADLTFTSALNDSTNSSFTYTVNDADLGVVSALMNITVNAVNDIPVATGNTVVASEDVALVIGPTDFTYSDSENDALASVTITGLNLNGGTLTHSSGSVTVTDGMTVTAAELADLTFTSALNDSTNSSFSYTVNDADAGVVSALMNITVNAVNDVPVATGNTVVTSEDVALVIGPTDFSFSDSENDALASVTITGLNLNGGTLTHTTGSVSVTNGMTVTTAELADLTFTSALNDSTDSSFNYTVNDTDSGAVSAVMNITVNAVNDAPVATGNTVVTSEDVPLVIGPTDFNFTDTEDDALASVTLSGLNLNGGTLTHSSGTVSVAEGMSITAAELADLTFTSALNDSTNSSFSYTVNDADAGVVSALMNITVNAVNDVPVATGNTVVASEDVALVIGPTDFSFSDSENDALASVTITGLNLNGGTLTHSSGSVTVTNGMTVTTAELADLTFTSALNDTTDSSFSYSVNDSDSGVVTALMNITVNAVNDAPVATGNTVVTSEDVPLVIGPTDFNFTDTEDDALASVTLSGLNLNGGTLTHSSGTVSVAEGMSITAAELADLTFTSALNDSTNSSFSYTVNDADAGVVSALMNITVNAVNDVPVATGNTVVTSEDVALVIGPTDFTYSDSENDALASVTITGLNLNGGTLTHSSGSVTVTDGMIITAAELADLTFTSALNDSTDSSFNYTVNDTDSGAVSAVMNITVNAVNDAPVATGNTVVTSEDVPLVIGLTDFNFTDTEDDALASVTLSGLNLNGGTLTHSSGTVSVAEGMSITAAELADLTFTSALNDSTNSSFSYTVNDADAGVVSALMNITVNAVNDVPVATGNTVVASEDVALVIGPTDFSFSDTEGDALTSVTITGLNLNGGTLTHNSGSVTVTDGMIITAAELADLTFTSALNDSTDSSFNYTVNDTDSGAVSAVMNITVNAVNDVPVATGNTVVTSEDVPLVIGPTDFNFTDTEDDALASVTLSGLNLNGGTLTHSSGTVSVSEGMSITAAELADLTFTSALNDSTNSSFSYTVNDTDAGVVTALMNITVNAVNDVPVATGNTVVTSEDVALVIRPTDFTYSDIENDALASVTITGLNLNGGTLTHSSGSVTVTDGMIVTAAELADLTFTSALNDSTDSSFNYTVNDTDSGAVSAVMNITVNAVNDVPVATGNTVVTSEDVPLVIGPTDFNFTDTEDDALASVTLSGLNLNGGTLTHSSGTVSVAEGMSITAAELADLTFTSALNDSTNSSFSYTVNDADAGVVSALMNITVNAVNDVPVATGNTVVASEDVALVIGPTDFSFSDSENDALASVTITGLNLNGGTLTHSSGSVTVTNGMTVTTAELADLTFTSALNDTTDSSFSYSVNDSDSGVVTALMNITVNAVNDAPVATGNTVVTSEDVPLVIGPTDFNFTDTEDDALASVTLSGLSLNGGTLTHSSGTVSVAEGMSITAAELADLTFTSALNDSTNSSFSYTVNDADAGVVSALMNITVNAVNDVPVATGNTVVASEDVALVIRPTDFTYSDIENDALASVTITGLNLNGGTLTHNSGSVTVTDGMIVTAAELADLTFTSALNDSTDSSFSYTVNDSDSGVVTALMNITVNAVNDVPVATGNTVVTSEDVPLVIGPTDFNFTDTEDDALASVTLSGLNLNGGTLTHSSGTVSVSEGMSITAAELADLTFTSALNDSTNSSFSYTVNDTDAGVVTALMNITVNAVNDVPVATGNTVVTSEDVALVIRPTDFTYSDIENDALASVTITGLNLNGGTLTHSSGSVTVTDGMIVTAAELADLTFTSALNDSTDSSFSYTVNDSDSGVVTALMNITVNAVNNVPVASGNTVIASEDTPLVIGPSDFSFSDVEDDALSSVTITGLNLNGGTLTHTAGSVSVSDGMIITAAQLADLTFTSALNDSTDSSFSYTVNDTDAGVVSALMNITVNAVNDVPVATGNTVVTSEDVALVLGPTDFTYSDVESDALASVTITGLNLNGGTLTHSSGSVTVTNGMTVTTAELADLTFTSALNDTTDSSFSYSVNDSDSGVVTALMNITVNAVNDAPVATGNTVVTSEDVPLVIGPTDFNFTDTEDDALASVTLSGLNLNGGTLTHSSGTVSVAEGMSITAAELADLTFTSALNDSTNSSFSYTVNDADAGVVSALMNITVNAVNDVPVATGNTVVTSEDVALVIRPTDFTYSDSENDALASVTITGLNLNGGTLTHSSGSVTVTDGMIITAAELADLTFTSALNDSTDSSFNYTVNDTDSGAVSAVMNITVNAVNDAPVATGNTVVTSEDVPLVIGLTDFNFTDTEDDALASVTLSGLNLNGGTLTHSSGTVSVAEGMSITAAELADLTFTSALNDSTNSSFSYTVNDADAGVVTALMNITVNAVNDVPVATGNTVVTSEDVALVIGPTDFSFSDTEGDALTSVTITGLNLNGGTLTHNSGSVTVTDGMIITAAELADLTFTSALNDSTDSSFNYTVNDTDSGAVSAVMNITVNAVNDVPVATGNTVVTSEDVPLVIGPTDFNFTDTEDDALASVTLSGLNLNGGTLTHSSGTVSVSEGMSITAAELADLTFTSALNDSTNSSFSYTVNDTDAGVVTALMNITVNAVNNVPVASGNTVIASEDTPLVIGASDFSFSDVEDDALASVTISGLNLNGGTLTHTAGSVSVSDGMIITAAQLADLTFTSALNDSTDSSFSYTVNDADAGVVSALMNITVNAVNDVPVATGNTVVTSEDVALVLGPTDFTYSDVESDARASVTITGLNLNGGTLAHTGGSVNVTDGMVIAAADLADLTFTPALNDSTDSSFSYTVNDSDAGVITALMNITVNAVNDVPVATGNTVVASEDVALVIRPTDFTYSDSENDALASVTITGLNLNGGTLTHSSGSVTVTDGMIVTAAELADLTFTSALNDSTDSSFNYSVNDTDSGALTALMNITVNAVNNVPVASGNTVIASEDTPLVIGASDFSFSDVEDDALSSVTITGLNLNGGTLTHTAGSVSVSDGMIITAAQLADLTFTSALNDSTDSSFSYTVNDTDAGVVSALMNITVNAVNDVPVATGNTVVTSEDVALVIGPTDFSFSDTEGDALTSVTITGLNLNGGTLAHTGGSVNVTDGMVIAAADLADLTFTPALNDSTDSSFSYTVNDADAGVITALMNITVNAVNDVPVATGNTVVASEDVALVIRPTDFTYSDSENDALASVTITGLNLNGGTLTHSSGSVDVTDGMIVTAAELADLTFTSALNDSTDSSFNYTVNDTDSGAVSAVMNITVNAVNDVPVATGNTVVTSEDVPLVIGQTDFNFTDTEDDALVSVTLSGLNLNGGTLTHSSGTVSVAEGMSITAAELADLTFASALNDSTNSSFSYTVNDADTGVVSALMNITVNAVNDVPVATGNTVVTSEDVALVIGPTDFSFSDTEGDALTSVTITGLNLNGGTLTHNSGSVTVTDGMIVTAAELADLTFTSALNDSTDSSFSYTVNDSDSGVVTALMNITVNAVNNVPVASGNTVIASEDTPLVIGPSDFSFSDVEDDALSSVTITGLNLNGGTLTHTAGSVSVSDGMIITAAQLADLTFTSALNDSTDSSFNYTVNDADAGVVSALMNITVNAVNDVPVASGNTVVASEDVALVIRPTDFTYSDSENDALASVTITGLNLNGGTLTHSSGSVSVAEGISITAAELADLTFTSALNDSTNSSFSYTVNDTNLGAVSALMNITVNAINDVPVATGNTITAFEDIPLVISPSDFNLIDADGDALTSVTITELNLNGGTLAHTENSIAITNGMVVTTAQLADLTFISAPNDSTNSSFTYTVNDADSGIVPAVMNIAVNAVNDASVATGNTLIATEDVPYIINPVDFQFYDVENDTLTSVTFSNLNLHGGTLTHSAGSVSVTDGMRINAEQLADLTFTSALNNTKNASLVYTVNDTGLGAVPSVMSIAITPVNDVPVALGNTLIASEDVPLLISPSKFNFYDVEDLLFTSITITDLNINGGTLTHTDNTVNVTNGMTISIVQLADLTFTTALNDSTDSNFTYTVNDADSGAVSALMYIIVNPANDAPVISMIEGNDIQILENQVEVVKIAATDIDGSVLYGVFGGADADLFNIDATSGDLRFVAAPNYESPTDANIDNIYEVVLSARDNDGAMDIQLLTVNVQDQNDSPSDIWISQSIVVDSADTTGGWAVGQLNSSDEDNNDITSYSLTAGMDSEMFRIGGPQNNTLILDDGIINFGVKTAYEVIIRATDSQGDFVDHSLTISVKQLPEIGQSLQAIHLPAPSPISLISVSTNQMSSVTEANAAAAAAAETLAQEKAEIEAQKVAEEKEIEEAKAEADKEKTSKSSVAEQSGFLFVDEGSIDNFALEDTSTPQPFSTNALVLVATDIASQNDSIANLLTIQTAMTPLELVNLADLNQLQINSAIGLQSDIETYVMNTPLKDEIQRLTNRLENSVEKEQRKHELVTEITSGITIGVTAGVVGWMLKSGSIMASVLSAMPAWKQLDPLPILNATKGTNTKPIEESMEESRVSTLFK